MNPIRIALIATAAIFLSLVTVIPAIAASPQPAQSVAVVAAHRAAAATPDNITSTADTTGAGSVKCTGSGSKEVCCQTQWHEKDAADSVSVILAWYRMTTYYCWNFKTVTYHSTSVTAGITTTGAAGGWQYDGTPDGIHFHCYVASGSTRNCSGNQEQAQGQFKACLAKCYSSWSPTITESENYLGAFFG
jgi:hypothetical protein